MLDTAESVTFSMEQGVAHVLRPFEGSFQTHGVASPPAELF